MTAEELLKMPVGRANWDPDIKMEIVRVLGGWIYFSCDEISSQRLNAIFIPEPPKATWYVTNTEWSQE